MICVILKKTWFINVFKIAIESNGYLTLYILHPVNTKNYNNSGESSEFYTNKLSRHMEWKAKIIISNLNEKWNRNEFQGKWKRRHDLDDLKSLEVVSSLAALRVFIYLSLNQLVMWKQTSVSYSTTHIAYPSIFFLQEPLNVV